MNKRENITIGSNKEHKEKVKHQAKQRGFKSVSAYTNHLWENDKKELDKFPSFDGTNQTFSEKV